MSARQFSFLIAAALAPALNALDPSLAISQYHKQYWQVEQGLPQSYVPAILPSPESYLLVGTAEGLTQFDGLVFRPLRAEPSLQLDHRWVSSLLRTRDGALWVGGFDGELLELREGKAPGRYRTGGSVFDLLEEAPGVVWAGTRNGLYRLQGGAMSLQAGLRGPAETSWNILARDGAGVLWVVTADGLYQRREGGFRLMIPSSSRVGQILTVRAGQGSRIWVGTSQGLYRLEGAGDLKPAAGIRGPVVSILADRDGVVWAACWGRGLYRLARGAVEEWTASKGLPDDSIRTLVEDEEGNLWIGMRSGGLGRWRDPRIVVYGKPEGLAGNYASIVAQGAGGALWMGTWRGGLYRWDGERLTSQPVPLPTLYFSARALAVDREGRQWIGNWEGMFEFDGRRYLRHGAEPDSPYRRVSALLFDRQGGLWVGTAGRGLYRFPGGRPVAPPPPALFHESDITALLEASDGTIWVGTSNGLRQIRAPGAAQRQDSSGLSAGTIHSLYEDSKGRIWAAATGRLLVLGKDSESMLDGRHGLPEHSLYRVLEDQEGNFWVSSPRGIYEISGPSVEEVLRGGERSLAMIHYGQEDGLRTIECHGFSQPSGARAEDGSLWFPTARGFVRIRPKRRTALPPPRVVIEEIAGSSGKIAIQERAELRAGARDVEIRYTAFRFSTPEKVRFRYRMEGYDPDWVMAGGARAARYNELPPGPLTFEVQARDPWGDWSPAATLPLYQSPRFHQTWWFALLTGLSVTGGGWALYRWRLHVVRGRYAAVLEERNRIGREWHDTLVAGFSAISLQIEAALANLAAKPERAAEILDTTRRMVHHYRAEARRVIWDLRDNRPEGEALPAAVENALRRAVEHRGIQTSVRVQGEPVALPADLQHNVLRICQEAISNSARHANPGRIEVELVFGKGELRAAVRDDGRGFQPEAEGAEAAGHFGLTVMRERAHRHGGILRIDSKPGGGAVVEASIPLPGVEA